MERRPQRKRRIDKDAGRRLYGSMAKRWKPVTPKSPRDWPLTVAIGAIVTLCGWFVGSVLAAIVYR